MKLFYWGRIRGPGGALRRNKKLFKFFIKKQYEKVRWILFSVSPFCGDESRERG